MSDLDAAIITPLESLMVKLPFGSTPMGRMALAATAGGAVAYYVRPSVSFTASGEPKSFILFDSKNPDAAIFPWWGFIVLPAVTFGLFL